MAITEQQVLDALKYVDDPDLNKDLVSLNMIKDVKVDGLKVSFTVELTTPACPMKSEIERACRNAIVHYVNEKAEIDINMSAKVTSNRQNVEMLSGVKNIIAVASGKGGVGKSTVAANLAVALARNGAKVGLVDADIYGPSVPLMFGTVDEKLYATEKDGKQYMLPVEKYGVKMLSIGYLADPEKAIVWRGPMASKALRQLFGDAEWGELDYMIIDLPPGTGDIHLTLVSAVPVTGAIIVSTPQEVALADARKGVAMFQMEKINVPVLGVVENMAYFTPAELPDNKYYIFGQDGAKDLAEKMNLPLLGQIPIVQGIREGGDMGIPFAVSDVHPASTAFLDLAKNVAQQISIRNANMAPTKRVDTIGY